MIAVPQPAFRAVMRALRMQELRPGVQIHNTGRSQNTLAANGTLVIRNPVQVELSSEPSLALAAAEIRDELGIVVAKTKLESSTPWRVALVRGVYEASAHDERGNVLARLSFTVETDPVSIELR